MRKTSSTLTPQELAIMKVVWRLQKATVREVHDAHCHPAAGKAKVK